VVLRSTGKGLHSLRVARQGSSKGEFDAQSVEQLPCGCELTEIMGELRGEGLLGACLDSAHLPQSRDLAQVLQGLAAIRSEMLHASMHLRKGHGHSQDQSYSALTANLPAAMGLDKLMAASRSKRITALRQQPVACVSCKLGSDTKSLPSCSTCQPFVPYPTLLDSRASVDNERFALALDSTQLGSRTERERVVYLEDSFGPVAWPNSVHGHAVYREEWHLQEASASEDLTSSSLPCQLSENVYKADTIHDDSVRDVDVSMLSDIQDWPWCNEMGYESDGPGTERGEKSLPADELDFSQGEESNARVAQVFNYTRSQLREAGKTVAVATRTGTLGEQQRIADNWIIKCFVMTPLELTVTKIQRFWRQKCKRRAYLQHTKLQYHAHRKRMQRREEVRRSRMRCQEDVYQCLVNRVRMFDCEVSKPKVREYVAARNIQCAIRCHQARLSCKLLQAAAFTIQRHYRRWVGARVALFRSRVCSLRWDREQMQLFRRQKYIATAVAEKELQILESYSAIEQEMLKCRCDIEVQDQTSERVFKSAATKLRNKMLASADLKQWVPQAGSVSGKTHYLDTLTGEVLPYHPHHPMIDKSVKALGDEMNALQRPQRNKMLAYLEALKGQHEDVYANVAELLTTLRELTFRAQFR